MERKQDATEIEKSQGAERLSPEDRQLFDAAWELAVNYQQVGRGREAVEFFLLAAALLERAGDDATPVYQTVLRLDDDNAVAASRLKASSREPARTEIFIKHILARHSSQQVLDLLRDERDRHWVTPPRGEQVTCPECGMGVAVELRACRMCGARAGRSYRKRPTASYHLHDPEPDEGTTSPDSENEDAHGSGRDGRLRPMVAVLSPDGRDQPVAESTQREVVIGTDPGCLGSGLDVDADGVEPRHAHIEWADPAYRVRDLGSGAGVFLVVRATTPCHPGQVLQVGAQTLKVERADEATGLAVAHLSVQDQRQSTLFRFPEDELTIGRCTGSLTFPNDTYVSDPHAKLAITDEGVELTDLGSRWGTFLKLPAEATLQPGAIIRVGRLLVALR
jgi:pSer/pThr/pTyr-binding forkhead associated (FHA) protein